MAVRRLCGHVITLDERVGFTPLDIEWFKTSDCEECRVPDDWKPSPGHQTLTDFLRANEGPSLFREMKRKQGFDV